MNVPHCPEWQAQPGYKSGPCYCVVVAGKPWHDCLCCRGGGLVGTVPFGVWQDQVGKLPQWTGDARFDPRLWFRPEPSIGITATTVGASVWQRTSKRLRAAWRWFWGQ